MPSRPQASQVEKLQLPAAIAGGVEGWRNQGWHSFPSETTRQLLAHWFDRDDAPQQFHPCQRNAIETAIYLHEIINCRTLRDVYEQFAPQQLKLSKRVQDEVDSIPFEKLCFKMATGSGKTWVLAALVVWQYFNSINGESNAPYAPRFLVVAPGLEVRSRLLDSFKGKRDVHTGSRDPATSDYAHELFMPDGFAWRGRFHLLDNILEPSDLRANTAPPDAPFVAISNWQQFARPKDPSLAEQIGLETPEEPKREVIADFLTEHPGLVIFNDEAHHVHGNKSKTAEELVWREFMGLLHDRMRERHGENTGLFMQGDFSATPFFGSAQKREYFPHIVYDYDLRDALNDMLVKQLFVEERADTSTEADFRAERDPETREVMKLSVGQKQLLDIGISKRNQLAAEFAERGLPDKPVLLILGEDTTVADLVHDHLLTCHDEHGEALIDNDIVTFYSGLDRKQYGYDENDARNQLGYVDENEHSLRVVNSVLKLREGFDKKNICVVCMLRAGQADLLLEQVVGRGLRLMFPESRDPAIYDAKRQAFQALQNGEQPGNSFDFLYIVEHPRFHTFYEELRKKGYLIASGSSERTSAAGDVNPVDAAADRIPDRDIAWPEQIHDEPTLPDLDKIDIKDIPIVTKDLDAVRSTLAGSRIVDHHLETGTRSQTWELEQKYFDYDEYLRRTTKQIVRRGKKHVLTGKRAEVARIVDDLTTHRLFGTTVDFSKYDNYKVLADPGIQDEIVARVRTYIAEHLGQPQYELKAGHWRRLSDLDRISVRDSVALDTNKCIYPRIGYPSHGGGLERDVMTNLLDQSGEVRAWCKLQRKHELLIPYRDETGLLRTYEVDFLLRTDEACFLLETKADKDLNLPSVGRKAKAAHYWCKNLNGLAAPLDIAQPDQWEYLILGESLFRENEALSFAALLPKMRSLRDQVIAGQESNALFRSGS